MAWDEFISAAGSFPGNGASRARQHLRPVEGPFTEAAGEPSTRAKGATASRYRIAALPGDGIGPEVMDAALRVLRGASTIVGGLDLESTIHEAGADHYRRTGRALPWSVLDDCRRADAVFLAAIGLLDVRLADGTEVQPEMMVGLRRALGLYAAVRPIKLYPGAPTPLKETGEGIDFVVVRENLEGLLASFGGGCLVDDQAACDTLLVTRAGTERIVEFAFRLAERRRGRPTDGRRRDVRRQGERLPQLRLLPQGVPRCRRAPPRRDSRGRLRRRHEPVHDPEALRLRRARHRESIRRGSRWVAGWCQ
jgi:Isocitrate/isopropylmalate dehydrogenase